MDQDARRRFERLPPNEQLRVLASFGHNLTIAARDTYEVGGKGLRWPERLRNINEVQHRVLAHIRALSLGDPKRYPDGILLEIFFEYGDEHLRAQTLSVFEDALNQDHHKSMTLDEDRPISRQEVEIVSWLLRNASTKEPLNRLLDGVDRLRVVGRCGCGCASVDFEKGGQSGGCHPIAEATAESHTGLKCGLILWGRDEAVTGLEIYEMDPDSTNSLPRLETLKTWDAT